jgi:hypothetical protein
LEGKGARADPFVVEVDPGDVAADRALVGVEALGRDVARGPGGQDAVIERARSQEKADQPLCMRQYGERSCEKASGGRLPASRVHRSSGCSPSPRRSFASTLRAFALVADVL